MEMPKVSNLVKIKDKNIIYNIVAYRELSDAEKVYAIRHYHCQKKVKKPKKETVSRLLL